MHGFFGGEDNVLASGRENSKGVDAVGAYTENTLIWKTATTERGGGATVSLRFVHLCDPIPKYQGSFHSYHPYPLVPRTNRSRGLPIIGFPSLT